MDLRRQQRFLVHLQSVLSGHPRVELVGTIMNLSKGGCPREDREAGYSGLQVFLRFDMSDETSPIYIRRQLSRWNRGGEVGVGFITVAPPHQERFDQL